MKKNLLVRVTLILLLTIACGFISYPNSRLKFKIGNFAIDKKFELSLGLDLSGGSHLVFEADTSKLPEESKQQALKSLKNVIEKRVNLFGLSEPNVQTSNFEGKDRIIVELPGVNDPKEATRLIGQTAQLVFVEVIETPAQKGSTPSQTAQLVFVEVIETPAQNGSTPSASIAPLGITGADLKNSKVVFDQNSGKPSVSFEVLEGSEKKFEEATKRLIGKRMIILLDQTVVTDAVVQDVLSSGGQITGNFTVDEANEMSDLLNSGALPVPVKLVEEKTIGATLGADSVGKSVKAGVIGLVMVSLFMILLDPTIWQIWCSCRCCPSYFRSYNFWFV